MWQRLQTITNYKGKTSHVAGTSFPDEPKTFFAHFDENNIETRAPNTHEDCVLSFSTADVSLLNMLNVQYAEIDPPSWL
jgi:hypothetical protein